MAIGREHRQQMNASRAPCAGDRLMAGCITRRGLIAGAAAGAIVGRARAAAPVRIGVLTEMGGPYAEDSGAGSVAAARFAINDFRKTQPNLTVELVSADAQTKPDVASAIAREWFDRGQVDMIIDVPVSNCALAVAAVTRQRNKGRNLQHQGPSKSWGDCDASGMTGRQVRCRGIVDGTDFAAG
jgi:hypothetical protein